jgi:iron(III) transport system permease protein
VAGAALVFVKVFDDLATPLLLNVTTMLAPQAYLKITSVGITDPMGYVISVIMVLCSLGAMALSAFALRGRDFATLQRGGGGLARRSLGAPAMRSRRCSSWSSWIVLSPHIGIFLLSIGDRVVVRGAARWLHARALRDGGARGRPAHLQHDPLLRTRRAH